MSKHLRTVGGAFLAEASDHSASTGHMLVDGPLVHVAWGSSVQTFGLHDMPLPRRLSTLALQNSVTGIAKKDDVLFVNTWTRGVNLVDVSSPSRPKHVHALPGIGRRTGRLLRLGDVLVVSWARDKMIGLFDISDPRAPRFMQECVLPEDIEDMSSDGERIFVANDTDGVGIFEIRDGSLVETARLLQDGEFRPQRIRIGRRGVYVFGHGGDRDLVVLDPARLENVVVETETELSTPSVVLDDGERTYAFHSHYTCSVLGADWRPETLFKQYFTDDVQRYFELGEGDEMDEPCTCMDDPVAAALIDGRLVTLQEKQLIVWALPEGSSLRGTTLAL